MKISELKSNPNNPRLIKDDKFLKLVNSIKEFPKMMELRPIVVDDSGMILGGNMRFKALQELKYKNVPDEWVKRAGDLTDDEKPFYLSDNNICQIGTYPLDYNFNGIEPKYLIGMSVPPVMTAQISNQIRIQWLDKLICNKFDKVCQTRKT